MAEHREAPKSFRFDCPYCGNPEMERVGELESEIEPISKVVPHDGSPYLLCGDQEKCGLLIRGRSSAQLREIYRSLKNAKAQALEINRLKDLVAILNPEA